MKQKIVVASGGLLLAGVLAACGSSETSGRPLPTISIPRATAVKPSPSAVSILQSDGYTPDSSLTSSLQSDPGSTPGVSSFAAGKSGKGIQLIIVCTSPTLASAAATGEKSTLGSSGITLSVNGDVVTDTGALSAWAKAGASPAA
jgi:hypothetical protein